MRHQPPRLVIYQVCRCLKIVAGVAAALIPASLKAEPSKIGWEWGSSIVKSLQGEAYWLIPCSLILVGLLSLLQKEIGAPWVWDHVHFLLDRIQEVAFPPTLVSGDLHHHRVTLFKYSTFCFVWKKWPWTGWLHAVERSGHSTRRRSVCFRAPDDADHAEGVAGIAWARKGAVILNNLPDLYEANLADKKLESYAKATRVSPGMLKHRLPHSRSFYAIPVESKNRIWGVIVIDSRSPEIKTATEIAASFSLIGKYLGKLLEKA